MRRAGRADGARAGWALEGRVVGVTSIFGVGRAIAR